MTRSVQAEILARLNERPEERCLCFYNSRGNMCWLSREQLYRRAVTVAQRLRREGVRPGDSCVIVLHSGEGAATVLISILLLGAVPLLIAPPTLVGGNLELHKTLRRVIRCTRPRVVIYSTSIGPILPSLLESFPTTTFIHFSGSEKNNCENEPFAVALAQQNDVVAMQLTSGTTATPRICVWDQKALLAALDGMAAAMALSASDICVNWTPLYHDMGLVNNFLLCLARGIPLALLSPQEFVGRPALWLRSLSETGATITWSPNFGFALTVRKAKDCELEGVHLGHVRGFWNAAERIHWETLEAFYRRFSVFGVKRHALKTNFGCAENIGGATFSALDAAPCREWIDRRLLDERGIAQISSESSNDKTVLIVSAGRPHPDLRVRILSRRGGILRDGCVGEICLETPSRMLHYHHNANETRRVFRGGLLHTGDLGYLRDGDLFWVGRLRERITIQGKKIDPSAFEAVLVSTPGVREGCFVAFGVPDVRLGTERVVVISEVARDYKGAPLDIEAAIRRRCFLELGVTPDDVMLIEPGTLAKTSSGKRRHRYFRRLYLAGDLDQMRIQVADPKRFPILLNVGSAGTCSSTKESHSKEPVVVASGASRLLP